MSQYHAQKETLMSTKYFNTYLTGQISNRYAIFEKKTDKKSNVVIDSYIPKMMVDELTGLSLEPIPQTAYTISAFFAEKYGIRQLNIETLLEVLGYNKAEINKLFVAVKKQKLNMIFAGLGGTGANTFHWLSEMMVYTGQTNLFQNVSVYDRDKVELTNLLRFPFSVTNIESKYGKKTEMFSNYGRLSANPPYVLSEFLQLNSRSTSLRTTRDPSLENIILSQKEGETTLYTSVPRENTFIYGAPDLESRKRFENFKFISATHGDDECSLIIKPLIDTSLQTESYGLIRLSSFFMNQLRMAIALLEFLAADDEKKWDTPAEEVFTFNFKQYIDAGNGKLKNKTINWTLEHDGLAVATRTGE